MVARERIRNAAAQLLHERGFSFVTMEDIAKAAAISRSTLYAHYPDKIELSVEIAVSYADKLCALVARLPGPEPSRRQIEDWIDQLAVLISHQHVSATLILELSARGEASVATAMIERRLVTALGQQIPAFARALSDARTECRARAWAHVVMRELGWACKQTAGEDENARAAKRWVAADIFERFVHAHIEMGSSI